MPKLKQYQPYQPYPHNEQFVAVWEHNGKPWSTQYRVIDGKLHAYDEFKDVWREDTLPTAPYQVFVVEGS